MRLDPTTTHIPVIVSSANTQLFRDSTALRTVMRCDTLQKPFDLDEMLAKIAVLIDPPAARWKTEVLFDYPTIQGWRSCPNAQH